jgi:GDP-L-fucose synthase
MENYNSSDIINIGTGSDMMISELANSIKDVIYPEGNIVFDNNISMNGTPRKALDVSKMEILGWYPKVSFIEGIKLAYQDFLNK